MLLDSLYHGLHTLLRAVGLRIERPSLAAQLDILPAAEDEQSGYHKRLGFRALCLVLSRLERLVGVPREAVEVQTVVPVSAADKRKRMRTEILHDVVERYAEMLHERDLCPRLVVPWHHLVENGHVASLLYIRHGAEDEPHRVVVESAADIIVTAFCERLVLVIAPSVGELGRGDVDDALSRTLRNLMDKAHEVLV